MVTWNELQNHSFFDIANKVEIEKDRVGFTCLMNRGMKYRIVTIGVHGKARSGKDTFANFFVSQKKNSGVEFVHKINLADPVKEAAMAAFNIKDRSCFFDQEDGRSRKGETDPFWNMTYRKMAQLMGTEACRRGIDDDIWLKCCFSKMMDIVENVSQFDDNSNKNRDFYFLIPDIRFPNEHEFIKLLNGKMFHIVREDQEEIADSSHCSENGLVFQEGEADLIHNTSIPSLAIDASDAARSI